MITRVAAAGQGRQQRRLLTVGELYALRTRKSGPRSFIDFHLLPEQTTAQASHQLCDRIESAIARSLGKTLVTIHVEPKENHLVEG